MNIDLIPNGAIKRVHVSQNDVGRTLTFELFNNSTSYTVPSGAVVNIQGTKPSGFGFSETCTVNGNVATIDTTEAMTDESGNIQTELSISYDDVVIGTSNFVLAVEKNPHPSNTTDGTQITAQSLQVQINELAEAIESGGSGLTDGAKQALLNCFAHVAWIDEHGQDYYDALEDALYPPATLTSISAVYTQSGTVYDTDSLDSLKSDLVVTAHYDNGTTQTITTYTLSGTLTVGTSTITVSYGGMTTTFNVTVTHAQSGEVEMSEFRQHTNIGASGFKLYSDGGETEYSDARFPTSNGRTSVSDVFTSNANIKVTFTPTANSFQCWIFGSTNFDNSFDLITTGSTGDGYWLKYITPSSDVFAYGWSSASHEFTASVKAGTRFMIMGISSSASDIANFTVEVI